MTAPSRLSDRGWSVLACPHCGAPLARTAAGARCERCGTEFGSAPSGQLDLRLRHPQRRQLELTLPAPGTPLDTDRVDPGPLRPNPAPEIDVSRVAGPCHLPRDLRSWFPRAATPGVAGVAGNAGGAGRELALDLGCGAQVHQEVCELAGFEYVGLDYSTPASS